MQFSGVDIVLSSTPASVSREWSPLAASAGAVVVDNSSAFRMDPDVPLVVPEVNPARHHEAPRNHRQSQLLHDPDGGRAQAAARLRTHPAHRRQHVPIGLGRRHERNSRARIADAGQRQRTHAIPPPSKFAAPDPRQLHPPDRRLPPERLHQGRNEDGERNPQDHGRRRRSTSAPPAFACPFRFRTANRS